VIIIFEELRSDYDKRLRVLWRWLSLLLLVGGFDVEGRCWWIVVDDVRFVRSWRSDRWKDGLYFVEANFDFECAALAVEIDGITFCGQRGVGTTAEVLSCL
jgi:hypothetical protein